MELTPGQVAVVTGAGSGIGLALAERFAAAGLHVVLADVQEDALAAAAKQIERTTASRCCTVLTDVSKEADVAGPGRAPRSSASAPSHVVCNNAGVAARADPWFGPLSSWEWVMGVNFWGVVHGCRTFLPHLVGGGHIVNTASIAGLMPGLRAELRRLEARRRGDQREPATHTVQLAGLPIGVSVLCPGWVRTKILEADRNWPAELGEQAARRPGARRDPSTTIGGRIAEGRTPASVADAVADAIARRPLLGHPAPGLPRPGRQRAWATIAERRRPGAARARPGHAAAVADRRRGGRRARPRRAGDARRNP